jgi:predicted CXXCH cytochrome family protein
MKAGTSRYISGIGLVILGIMALAISCAPVPEATTRGRQTCAQCHPELVAKYQVGTIHDPVKKQDCEACHLPHGMVGGVIERQKTPVLCISCHPFFREGGSKKSVHKPVREGKCGSCHEMHNSPYPGLLKATRDESCFACHAKGQFTKSNVHAPLQEGCQTCHDPHMADQPRLLSKAADALCASCHQTDTGKFRTAHQNYPVGTHCLDCHAQHSSNRKGLLKEVTHAPVQSGDCNDCHQVAGAAITLKKVPGGLCLSCHADIKATAQHMPVKDGDCQACHAVHGSDFVGMLSKTPGKVFLALPLPATVARTDCGEYVVKSAR